MAHPGNCAKATTAAEARYRIDRPNSQPRSARIIALDTAGARAVDGVAGVISANARLLVCVGRSTGAQGLDAIPQDLDLRDPSGRTVRLSDELAGADTVVMIAAAGAAADAAAIIGRACADRALSLTGIVIDAGGDEAGARATRAALRPHARMLVVASDAEFVPELLAALRA